MTKSTLYIFFIYLWSSNIFGQLANESKIIKSADKIPIDSSVKIGKLSNGLTYYIKQNATPKDHVELRLVLNVGSILEEKEQSGLAHFMEHMNFNGTQHFKKNEMIDYLQSIGVKFGAHLNAETGFDETTYVLPIPSNDKATLDKGFLILRDWAQGALLNTSDINEERGVILEEYRFHNNAKLKMIKKYYPKLMYGSKYPERFPIGTKHNLETFDPKSLRQFYKDWYRPDLMAVIAVGDINVESIEQTIKNNFENIPLTPNAKERKLNKLKNHQETLIAIESDKEAEASIVEIVYKDVKEYAPNTTISDYKNTLVSSLINIMASLRFSEIANSNNAPFLYSKFYRENIIRSKEASNIKILTAPNEQLKGLTATLAEVERIKRYGFNLKELNLAKEYISSTINQRFLEKDKRNSNEIINEYINNFLQQEPIPNIDWIYKATNKILPVISLEKLNKSLPRYFHDENRVIIVTGPTKSTTELQIKEVLNKLKTQKIEPYKNNSSSSPLVGRLPNSGHITNTTRDEKLGITKLTLSNGATVVYKKTNFKNSEILFNALSLGGTSLYTDTELKKTAIANNALTEAGINGHSKNELLKLLLGKNVSVSPFIGEYFEGINGRVTPKDLETLFQLTYLYFTSLNKNYEVFNEFIKNQKKLSKTHLDSPLNFFKKEINDFLNEGNSRYIGFPSEDIINNSDYNLAFKKYLERFADASDFTFYFVGSINEDKLKEYAIKYLAVLPSTHSKELYNVPTFRPLSGKHSKVVNKGKDPKSIVNIQYQGPIAKYNHKEKLAFNLLTEIAEINLTEKLREQESGIYTSSVTSDISNIPYNWYNFTIAFYCAPENVDKLKNITLHYFRDIANKGIHDKDLKKAKEALIGVFKNNLNNNGLWLQAIVQIDFHNIPHNNFLLYENRVNSIKKEDIQSVVQKYLTKGYILGVLNPEK